MSDIQVDVDKYVSTEMPLAILHCYERFKAFRTEIPQEVQELNDAVKATLDAGKPFDVVYVRLTVEELWGLINSESKDAVSAILHKLMTTGELVQNATTLPFVPTIDEQVYDATNVVPDDAPTLTEPTEKLAADGVSEPGLAS